MNSSLGIAMFVLCAVYSVLFISLMIMHPGMFACSDKVICETNNQTKK